MLHSRLLAALPGLVHGLSTRADGSVAAAAGAAALATRRRIVGALTGSARQPLAPRQVHGARVAVVTGSSDHPEEADGVATARAGLPLMVQGADCPLLVLVDAEAPALALIHSGWRGTVARIAARGVASLAALGAHPERIRAALFPGIARCCFDVGPEVIAACHAVFGARAAAWHVPGGAQRRRLDLHAAITATLREAGVDAAHIDAVGGCTACGTELWSHRASGGAPERHGLFAALRA